ncbi:MAG: tetratricopeptide repeat protein [Pseudomonadota bacterium]
MTAVANKVRRKPALDFDALAGLTQTWKDFKSPRMLEFPEDGNELGKLDDSWTANPPTGVSEVQEKKGFDYAKGSAVATIVVAVVTTLAFALDLVPQSISPTQLPEGKSTKLTSPIIPNAPAAPIVAQDVASKENLDTTKAADLAEVNGIGAENNQPKLAYADEKSAFDAAKATRRIKPLVDFIKSYPKTSFYAEADDAAWASVERQNKLYGTPAALEAYLQGFALGKHRRKAEELLAERYYEDKDYARSLPLARRLCETDSAEGCYVFGSHAYFGRGLSIDESLAANAYELGCDEGSARACGKAGYIYLFGKGVDEDEVKAAKFLNKGCDGSIAEACYHLGRAYHLGYGVAIDYDAAFLYYRKSCLGGAPAGCNSLGYMYHEGKGIGRDYNSAIIYYRKACDSDVFVACSNLGLSYESGDGVTRDLAEAKRFFKKACDGNYKMACRYLADLEEN